MKKVLSLFLAVAMFVSLAACGGENKAFEASKIAYNTIDAAYEITQKYSDDIYKVWRMGIYEKEDILDYGIEHIASELSLSEDELKDSVDYWVKTLMPADWYGLTNNTDWLGGYNKCIIAIDMDTDNIFDLVEENLFSFCVMLVQGAYIANGQAGEAQTALDAAKEQMKELSEKYSGYEHYTNLKGYYVATSSLFEFCQNPSGSFEQCENTVTEYWDEASDCIRNLDYIFEE